jgi:hypothetical protein
MKTAYWINVTICVKIYSSSTHQKKCHTAPQCRLIMSVLPCTILANFYQNNQKHQKIIKNYQSFQRLFKK